MRVSCPPRVCCWLLVLLASLTAARAQQVTAPSLGQAAAYGLLSAASIAAQSKAGPLPIQVRGKAGAKGTIDAGVQASAGVAAQGAGSVLAALADAQQARAYCSDLGGSSLSAQLGGQTLTGGVYLVAGSAVLDESTQLTLSGDTATVFVLNITGSLTLEAQAQVVLSGVLPQHVFWNVDQSLQVASGVSLSGVVLTGGSATLQGMHLGHCALLSGGAITLDGLSAVSGHNQFYASSYPTDDCGDGSPPNACPFTPPSNELIQDGSFEVVRCLPGGLNALDAPSSNCFWESGTLGTADYYHTNGAADVAVPYNLAGGSTAVYALAQNVTSSTQTGDAYAGFLAYDDQATPGFEYVGQRNQGTLSPSHRYYAEFAVRLAPASGLKVDSLAMVILDGAPLPLLTPRGVDQLHWDKRNPLVQGKPTRLPTTGQGGGWHRIQGTFTPKRVMSGFTVLIGNFVSDSQTYHSASGNPATGSFFDNYAYYYLDNVTLSVITEAGPNVTLGPTCLGGIGDADVQLGTLPLPAIVPGVSYTWTSSPNDPNLVTNVANPTVHPGLTTTYTLTVAIPGQAGTYTTSATVSVVRYNYAQLAGATYANPVAGGAAYEIGAAGTTTTLSGNGGTVTFRGRYHVLGNVRLTNGTFRLQPGTVFFIDSNYSPSSPTYSPPTRLTLDGATLQLSGATLQATNCTDRVWDGVYLTNGSTIRTLPYNNPLDESDPNNRRSLVRDMATGINSSAGNHYYLSGTDFLHNDISLYEYPLDKVALPNEGVVNCTFRDGNYGLLFEEIDYFTNHVFGGNYDQARFSGNTFQDLRSYGIYATTGNGHFEHNTFRTCGVAAIATWSVPQAGRATFTGNTIEVPAATGPVYNYYGTGPLGLALNDGVALATDNLISSAAGAPPPSAAAPVPRVGIYGRGLESGSLAQLSGNSVTGLDFGVLAALASQYPGSPGTTTLTANTLQNNAVGLSLAPGFLYPYSGRVDIIANVRCNSFINDASSQVANPIGLWIRQNAVINGGMSDANNPNGNAFQFQANQTRYILNDGANLLFYKPYDSQYEKTVLTSIGGATSGTVLGGAQLPPGGACQSSTAGVHTQRMAGPPPADFATQLDSLRQADLPPAARLRLQRTVLASATDAGQLASLEAYLPGAAPAEARTLGLGLLDAYRQRHDGAGVTRLRTRLQAASPEPELLAYLRLTQALDEMPSFLPGLRPLRPAARALLNQVAISGTSSAEYACRLLRAYEPTCACLLAPPAPAARPTSAARPVTASQPLGAYPNPAGATLHVPLPALAGAGPAELRAYDATGRLVLRQPVGGDAREALVEVRAWAAGLYQLVLTHEGQVLGSQRLAVQPQP